MIPDRLYYFFKYRLRWQEITERLTIAIAWRLPRPIVYWSAIRLMAYATQGKYADQVVGDLYAMDALKRWDKPND